MSHSVSLQSNGQEIYHSQGLRENVKNALDLLDADLKTKTHVGFIFNGLAKLSLFGSGIALLAAFTILSPSLVLIISIVALGIIGLGSFGMAFKYLSALDDSKFKEHNFTALISCDDGLISKETIDNFQTYGYFARELDFSKLNFGQTYFTLYESKISKLPAVITNEKFEEKKNQGQDLAVERNTLEFAITNNLSSIDKDLINQTTVIQDCNEEELVQEFKYCLDTNMNVNAAQGRIKKTISAIQKKQNNEGILIEKLRITEILTYCPNVQKVYLGQCSTPKVIEFCVNRNIPKIYTEEDHELFKGKYYKCLEGNMVVWTRYESAVN